MEEKAYIITTLLKKGKLHFYQDEYSHKFLENDDWRKKKEGFGLVGKICKFWVSFLNKSL